MKIRYSIAGFHGAGQVEVLLFVPPLDMGLAVGIDVDVQHHRVAADGAVLDVVLVSAPRDIHRHDDFFAARVACVDDFLVG
jgi:hypothetical protein